MVSWHPPNVEVYNLTEILTLFELGPEKPVQFGAIGSAFPFEDGHRYLSIGLG